MIKFIFLLVTVTCMVKAASFDDRINRLLNELEQDKRALAPCPHGGSCGWINGECKDVGEEWEYACVTYTCQKEASGTDSKFQTVVARGGCRHRDGSCKAINEEWVENGCLTRKCSVVGFGGAKWYKIELARGGCEQSSGECKHENEEWFDGCDQFTCKRFTFPAFTVFISAKTGSRCGLIEPEE